jgi:hypothetical protein
MASPSVGECLHQEQTAPARSVVRGQRLDRERLAAGVAPVTPYADMACVAVQGNGETELATLAVQYGVRG